MAFQSENNGHIKRTRRPNRVRIESDFVRAVLEARVKRSYAFKARTQSQLQPRIIYPDVLPSKCQSSIDLVTQANS